MNVHVVRGPDGLNRRAFSAADVRRMTEAGILGENDPFELVDGELIEMAAKGFSHDRIRDLVARQIILATDNRVSVSVEGTLQLDPHTLLEPDLLVYRDVDATPSSEGYKVVSGANVLLAIEVAVSSLAYDRRRKAVRYAEHGMVEYWIIDVAGARTLVHTGPLGEGYRQVDEFSADTTLTPRAPDLAGFSIRLADLL